MQINFKDLIKDQAIYIGIAGLSAVLCVGLVLFLVTGCFDAMGSYNKQSSKLNQLKKEVASLKEQVAQKEADRLNNPPAKKILELKGNNFGTDASFAPLFDNVISLAKVSGIRIRSVGYNYTPENDPVFKAGMQGHNVCELQMTVVGNYSQVQAFMKNVLAQNYLVNIAKIEIVSWKRDQSVLIANLNIRFYTKTL